jgi:hypothetical protein
LSAFELYATQVKFSFAQTPEKLFQRVTDKKPNSSQPASSIKLVASGAKQIPPASTEGSSSQTQLPALLSKFSEWQVIAPPSFWNRAALSPPNVLKKSKQTTQEQLDALHLLYDQEIGANAARKV